KRIQVSAKTRCVGGSDNLPTAPWVTLDREASQNRLRTPFQTSEQIEHFLLVRRSREWERSGKPVQERDIEVKAGQEARRLEAGPSRPTDSDTNVYRADNHIGNGALGV